MDPLISQAEPMLTTALMSFYRKKKGAFLGLTQALEDSQAKLKRVSGPGTTAAIPGKGGIEIQASKMGWGPVSLNACSDEPLGWKWIFYDVHHQSSVRELWEAARETSSSYLEGKDQCWLMSREVAKED